MRSHPGVWPYIVPPHTQLPPRRAQKGLKAMFPRRSYWSRARPQSAPFTAVPAQSPENSGFGLRAIIQFQLPAKRARKSMPLYFLNSSRLTARAWDRPAVSSPPVNLLWALGENGEVFTTHLHQLTEPQVLDNDPCWSGGT